jgi:uracil-DNA glycosylase
MRGAARADRLRRASRRGTDRRHFQLLSRRRGGIDAPVAARCLSRRAERGRIPPRREAAGYRGARVSGIPFTSERQLTGSGPAEASATIVRRVLAELGLEEVVLCWNLVPTHPHLAGHPASNRAPTRGEIAAGRPFVDELAAGRRVLGVGRLAALELGVPYVRHPSHGGGAAFRAGLIEKLDD